MAEIAVDCKSINELIRFKINNFPLIKIGYMRVYALPAPSSLSLMWNGGSLLALTLFTQLFTGVFLSFHYSSETERAFSRVVSLTRDVNIGWLIRFIHINGARIFFVFLYFHVARGLYYLSWKKTHTWMSGVTIFILVIATAFLGYVLPWGQISFWGATVITNLFSAIPVLGKEVVFWIWGGFAVDRPTLTRFFGLHFLLPIIILGLTIIHLFFLHAQGSNNPLGLPLHNDKIPFLPYYVWKDLLGVGMVLWWFIGLNLLIPYIFSDPENFIEANPLSTPLHIQPEWYFLFAYAILRSIPNKLGGVVALGLAVIILYIFPFWSGANYSSKQFYFINKLLFYRFISVFLALTFLGSCPVETPYVFTRLVLRVCYFRFFLGDRLLYNTWESVLNSTDSQTWFKICNFKVSLLVPETGLLW